MSFETKKEKSKLMKIAGEFRNLQRASEEEYEEGGIIASKAFNILVGSKAGLGRRGGEGVGVEGANKSVGPRRGVAGKVVGGELREGVESEEREKSF